MLNKSTLFAGLIFTGLNAFAATHPAAPVKKTPPKALPVIQIHCGDKITQSAKIGNDLNCPDTTDIALMIVGDNISIDGQGHMISAPKAQNGIYATGSKISITGIGINGITQGTGLFAYDCPGLVVTKNDFSSNQIGIMLYSEHKAMTNVQIVGNEANGNSLFGIRATYDGQGDIRQPHIANNDLGNSGGYALYIGASSYEITANELNQMSFSSGGIFLHGGDFYLHDFTLTSEEIQKAQIFIENARSVTVKNVDLSTNYQHQTSDEAIGLDLYRAQKFDIFKLRTTNNDVGLKLETEKDVPSEGRVRCSQFLDNFTSGIMVSSYDKTPYGQILVDNSTFTEPPNALKIFIQPGTIANPAYVSDTDCNGNIHK